MIHSYIKETLGMKMWGSSDLHAGLEEMMILRNWEIYSIPEYVGNMGEGARAGNNPKIWEPLLQICLSSTLMEHQKGIQDQ